MTLNGPSKIYHLKPVYHLPEQLETHCTMYKMKNLHQQPVGAKVSASSTNSLTDNNENKVIADVLKRQEELIKHLQNIQTKVTDLKLELSNVQSSENSKSKKDSGQSLSKLSPKEKSTSSKSASLASAPPINLKDINDKNIVINLSPHRPAYSILTLHHVWSDVFSAQFNIHVHSSVNEVPAAFSKNKSKVLGSDLNDKLNVRLIWKDVPDTELITSPIKQANLLGEVSMLRLFHRLLSNTPVSVEDQIQADSVLDICHQLLYATQKNTVFSLGKKLGALLGSDEWLLGSPSMSYLDAAAWSAILNCSKTVEPHQLGSNIAKWCSKINSLVGITKDMIPKK